MKIQLINISEKDYFALLGNVLDATLKTGLKGKMIKVMSRDKTKEMIIDFDNK
ncbi:MAG: hypothetical protein ACREV6_19570 [Clostridium sp.]|uniref:hypothetical protein n=1 Tax=Clostridium sp. TaxID=1506 RepID=UPI003D6D108A